MTIQLELDPETEARLTAQAIRHGVAPEQYAGEAWPPQPSFTES